MRFNEFNEVAYLQGMDTERLDRLRKARAVLGTPNKLEVLRKIVRCHVSTVKPQGWTWK